MVSPYRFHVDQRVVIRRRGGGKHRQPSESSRGALGVIAPQMTDDWTGTKLELEAGTPNVYYVTLWTTAPRNSSPRTGWRMRRPMCRHLPLLNHISPTEKR